MLRPTIQELARLARLPSHQLTSQSPRVLSHPVRTLATNNTNNTQGHDEDKPDIPPPSRSPISPPQPQELPKIDRSRPLPPPAYAGSRLDNIPGSTAEEPEMTFQQPDYPDDWYRIPRSMTTKHVKTWSPRAPRHQGAHQVARNQEAI